jgi:hypothetical protein
MESLGRKHIGWYDRTVVEEKESAGRPGVAVARRLGGDGGIGPSDWPECRDLR